MAQIGGVTALALLVAGRTPAARLPHAPVPAGTARSVGELKFCIRDVSTGYGVRAVILLYPTQGVGPDRSGGRWVPPRTNPLVLQSDPQGRGRYKLPARAYLVEVSAQGYLPLRTDWVIDAGSTLPTTVMMEPERPPEELRKEVLERKCRPGFALVYGFVVDAATLSPLPNVRIVVREAGTEAGRATTNPRGYFEILVPVHPIAPVPAPAEAPYALADLLAGAPGYKKYIVRNEVLVDGGGVGFNADMEPGRGRQERNERPKFCGGNASERPSMHPAEEESGRPGQSPARGSHGSGRARLAHPALQIMGSLHDDRWNGRRWLRGAHGVPRADETPARTCVTVHLGDSTTSATGCVLRSGTA